MIQLTNICLSFFFLIARDLFRHEIFCVEDVKPCVYSRSCHQSSLSLVFGLGCQGTSFMIQVILVLCEMVVLHYEFQVLDSIAVIPVEVTFLVCLYTNAFCESTASLN
jgi:hypothetical protein